MMGPKPAARRTHAHSGDRDGQWCRRPRCGPGGGGPARPPDHLGVQCHRASREHDAAAASTTPPAASTTASAAGAASLAAAKPFHPSRLAHIGSARQVVVVTSSSWSTSYATVRTYQKDSSGWHKQFKNKDARLGTNGFAHFGKRRQDTGKTPAGTYALPRAFGSAADPGTALSYRQFDRNDWWPYDPRDPRTYNVAQYHGRSAATRWRKSWAEHLWHFHDQYAYSVVIDYNLPSGVYRSGSQRFASSTANTARGWRHLPARERSRVHRRVRIGRPEGHAQDRPLARPRAASGDRDGAHEGDRPGLDLGSARVGLARTGRRLEPVSPVARRACRAAAARPWCASGRCGSR